MIIVDSNWTVIGANVIILFFLAAAHMLQLLNNSITIFLFDALKQTESMLNIRNERMSNGKRMLPYCLK